MLLVYRDTPGSGQIENVIIQIRRRHMSLITSHSTLYVAALRSNILTEKLMNVRYLNSKLIIDNHFLLIFLKDRHTSSIFLQKLKDQVCQTQEVKDDKIILHKINALYHIPMHILS